MNGRSIVALAASASTVAALTLAALTGAPASASPSSPASHAVPAPSAGGIGTDVEISVMTQNIFYGGDDYDLETGGFCPVSDGCPEALHRIRQIIAGSGADVVGIQEAERNTERLARMLGWYGSNRAHIISRYPLIDPPHSHGDYVFVEPTPGQVVAVANIHLPSDPYGPYAVRDGATRKQVLRLERTVRLPALQEDLRVLPALAAQGIPVFLTGDFNSPSALDWTKAVSQVRDDVPYPVKWPVSAALAAAGFEDSYRDTHPDPVAVPGFTWTPGGPETDPHEVFDRIDWVLYDGPVSTIDSRLIGEIGGPDVDAGFPAPYPTDHRGVVSTFQATAATPPVLVSPSTRSPHVGDTLGIDFHAPGAAGESVAIVRKTDAGLTVRTSASTGPTGTTDGSVTLSTDGLREGTYAVALLDAGGHVLSQAPIWV